MSRCSSLTAIALGAALMAGGCDRHNAAAEQANAGVATVAAGAPASAPAATVATPAHREGEPVVNDVIGTLDRSHHGEAAAAGGFLDPAGRPTTLATLAGRPVLVNLWATWCGPCVREMPTLDRAAATMRVVTVAQDLGDDSVTKVAPFLTAHRLARLPAYRDPQANLSVAYQASLPTSILFDATGHEVWRMTGGMDWTSGTAQELLAEAR